MMDGHRPAVWLSDRYTAAVEIRVKKRGKAGEQGEIANTAATVRERGYSLCGSVETVTRLLGRMIETLNTDLIVPWISVGPMPIDTLLKSNDLLVDKVLPRLGIKLDRYQPTLRPEFTGTLWRSDQA